MRRFAYRLTSVTAIVELAGYCWRATVARCQWVLGMVRCPACADTGNDLDDSVCLCPRLCDAAARLAPEFVAYARVHGKGGRRRPRRRRAKPEGLR